MKRNKTIDFLLLVGSAVLFAALGTGAFWMADDYHINPAWLFAVGAALLFFAVVGWGYRSKFRSPAFVIFFLAWLVVHVVVFLLAIGYLGLVYYVPLVVLELWIGYAIAIHRFGPPSRTHYRF